jgi:phosphate uptake regulator
MKRKINQVGTGTLTVSLPSKWVKTCGVKKGDEIELAEAEQGLIIRCGELKQVKKEIIYHLDTEKALMRRLLTGPYVKGISKITINYKNPEIYKKIQEAMRLLLGFEIVEQGKEYVVLEEISQSTDEKFLNILNRLFFMFKSFANEVQQYLKAPYKNVDSLIDAEIAIDRLTYYCRRLVNLQRIDIKPYESSSIYHVICLLENASDELKKIIRNFYKKKKIYYDKSLDIVFEEFGKTIELTHKKLTNYLGKKDYKEQVRLAQEQKRLSTHILEVCDNNLCKDYDTSSISARIATASDCITHMSEELF